MKIRPVEVLKSPHIKFHENPSSGTQDVPCGRSDEQTNVMNLIVAFHNFSKAPKEKPLQMIDPTLSLICLKPVYCNLGTLLMV